MVLSAQLQDCSSIPSFIRAADRVAVLPDDGDRFNTNSIIPSSCRVPVRSALARMPAHWYQLVASFLSTSTCSRSPSSPPQALSPSSIFPRGLTGCQCCRPCPPTPLPLPPPVAPLPCPFPPASSPSSSLPLARRPAAHPAAVLLHFEVRCFISQPTRYLLLPCYICQFIVATLAAVGVASLIIIIDLFS